MPSNSQNAYDVLQERHAWQLMSLQGIIANYNKNNFAFNTDFNLYFQVSTSTVQTWEKQWKSDL